MNRELERRHTEDNNQDYNYDPDAYPQWCLGGLTRSQKRRVQHLRNWEQEEEHAYEEKSVKSQRWCFRNKTNNKPSASVNMVFVLPIEFSEPVDEEDNEKAMAQLALDPMQATFDKPAEEERRHLKPLYVKGHIDGRPMTKMLIDGGAAVNIMPYATYRKISKGEDDLIKTDMMLKDFKGCHQLEGQSTSS
jgi:hypothetical protein